MSVDTHRVLIGACDWNHPAWLNDFYSEDLPEDWQLGFYSNEFPVVYVPAARWINNDELGEWNDEVSDTFGFILEIPYDILIDELRFTSALERAKKLAGFCLGLVFQVKQNIDTALLQKHLTMAKAFAPVCIDKCGDLLSDELSDVLKQENISEVWDGSSENNKNLNRGLLAVTHIEEENIDMAALRKIIEGCLNVSTEDRVSVLCFDGTPPSLEVLRNADIILNLL